MRVWHLTPDPGLVKYILELSLRDPGERGNNVGGWRSRADLANRAGGLALPGYEVTKAWGVVHRDGSYHATHTHHGSDLTSVWYLTGGSDLEFEHLTVTPNPGMVVTFGRVPHRSKPHYGEEPRVCLVANYKVH